jgi:hypothetical protein
MGLKVTFGAVQSLEVWPNLQRLLVIVSFIILGSLGRTHRSSYTEW